MRSSTGPSFDSTPFAIVQPLGSCPGEDHPCHTGSSPDGVWACAALITNVRAAAAIPSSVECKYELLVFLFTATPTAKLG